MLTVHLAGNGDSHYPNNRQMMHCERSARGDLGWLYPNGGHLEE